MLGIKEKRLKKSPDNNVLSKVFTVNCSWFGIRTVRPKFSSEGREKNKTKPISPS